MTYVPIRRILNGWVDPSRVWQAGYQSQHSAFWLDAGPDAESGTSYMGAGVELLRADQAGAVTSSSVSGDHRDADEPLSVSMYEALDARIIRGQPSRGTSEFPIGEAPHFALGWVGWFGYESALSQLEGAETETAQKSVGADQLTDAHSAVPESLWMRAELALEFDHTARVITLLAETDDLADAWCEKNVPLLYGAAAGMDLGDEHPAIEQPSRDNERRVRWRHSDSDYLDMIAECQRRIRAGDAYQLCLTNRVSIDLEGSDRRRPHEIFARLRRASPSHHGGLIVSGDTALISSSPEQFLTLDSERRLVTKPIKGTRPRSGDPARDASLANELANSEKERAENLMIVDLMRNDLQHVAHPGSVRVTGLHVVESYRQVHQLVSTVEATMLPGLTAIDAIRACLPAGSMTGAPKLSAIAILRGLERGPRGVYSGAFGYLGVDGAMDLAMTIRSIVLSHGLATIGAGGGITIDSVPREELEETKLKARALIRAVLAEDEEASRER